MTLEYIRPKNGPVLPEYAANEVVYAKNQPEYIPLRTLRVGKPSVPVISRWSPTESQRQLIAEGKDIFLEILTFGQALQPVLLYLGDDSDSAQINESRLLGETWNND